MRRDDRYNLTFRNPAVAPPAVGHKGNIRPKFSERFTLGEMRRELGADVPFGSAGDGLPSAMTDALVAASAAEAAEGTEGDS